MKQKSLIIRTDANKEIGTGHFMRCLALAQGAVKENIRVVFATTIINKSLLDKLTNNCVSYQLLKQPPGSEAELLELNQIIADNNADWLIIDGYHFSANFLSNTRNTSKAKVLFIDDYAHLDLYDVDYLLNQNISAHNYSYNLGEKTELLLGNKYVLLRNEFVNTSQEHKNVKSIPNNILITMGGSDPHGMTLKTLNAIEQLDRSCLNLKIILGALNPDIAIIKNQLPRYKAHVSIHKNVENMPSYIRWADIVIAAAGSTSWEICYLGTPAVITAVSENQMDIAKYLDKKGCAIYAGRKEDLTVDGIASTVKKLVEDHNLRQSMSLNQQATVDALGRKRVLSKLWSMKSMMTGRREMSI